MTDKIIFLDVDGVLTSTKETPGSYLNHSLDQYGISPSCLKNLKKLIADTGAKIIISSNWRIYRNQKQVELHGKKIPNPLIAVCKELGEDVIDFLPKTAIKHKAEALVKWFDAHDFDGEFVVLDDDKEEHLDDEVLYSICDHLVFVNYKVGLQQSDCEKAKSILKVN